jgi:hypothetical protein
VWRIGQGGEDHQFREDVVRHLVWRKCVEDWGRGARLTSLVTPMCATSREESVWRRGEGGEAHQFREDDARHLLWIRCVEDRVGGRDSPV